MRAPPATTPMPVAAQRLAARLLHDDPARLRHVRATATTAMEVAQILVHPYAADLVAAAWLHDIGYAPAIAHTGFHPLDGALYLAGSGWPDRVVMLVAHHSHAALVAPFYSADHHLALIDHVPGTADDVLAYADLVAGHDGRATSPHQRIEEMRERHDATQNVPREIREGRYRLLLAAADRVHGEIERSTSKSA